MRPVSPAWLAPLSAALLAAAASAAPAAVPTTDNYDGFATTYAQAPAVEQTAREILKAALTRTPRWTTESFVCDDYMHNACASSEQRADRVSGLRQLIPVKAAVTACDDEASSPVRSAYVVPANACFVYRLASPGGESEFVLLKTVGTARKVVYLYTRPDHDGV